MPRLPFDDDDDSDFEWDIDADMDDFTEDELNEFYDLIGDFPELDDLEAIYDWDDDKYGGTTT